MLLYLIIHMQLKWPSECILFHMYAAVVPCHHMCAAVVPCHHMYAAVVPYHSHAADVA